MQASDFSIRRERSADHDAIREVVADQLGEPFVVLEGAPVYYARFGFGPASAHGVAMPLPDWAPVEAARIVCLQNDDPTLAGSVVYPTAFDGVE